VPGIRLTDGVFAQRTFRRSSPEWQAAFHLAKGTRGWAAWRGRQVTQGKRVRYIRLDRFEFEELDLAGADLTSLGLRKAVFVGCDLRGAQFNGVNLNDAVFHRCRLEDVSFRGARLVRADLRDHDLSGIDIYESVRTDWQIEGAVCTHAWVRDDRHGGKAATQFDEGEFVLLHGGLRIMLHFPDGGQSIDLMALPFHFESLRQEYPDLNLVLCGLQLTPTLAIEVRIETGNSRTVAETKLGASFAAQVPATRQETEAMLTRALEQSVATTLQQAIVIERMLERMPTTSVHVVQAAGSSMAMGIGDQVTVASSVHQSLGMTPAEFQGLIWGIASLAEQLAARGRAETVELLRAGEDVLKAGDPEVAKGFLRKHGQRLVDVAQEVGTATIIKLLHKAMGLE